MKHVTSNEKLQTLGQLELGLNLYIKKNLSANKTYYWVKKFSDYMKRDFESWCDVVKRVPQILI